MYVTVHGERSRSVEQRRALAERLLRMSEHMTNRDRMLLRSIYDRGLSASELARAVGVHPRTVRRRVQRLVERAASPVFTYVLREREGWPSTMRRVAELVFLEGCSQREAAKRLSVSLHQVRQVTVRVQVLQEQAEQHSVRSSGTRHAVPSSC